MNLCVLPTLIQSGVTPFFAYKSSIQICKENLKMSNMCPSFCHILQFYLKCYFLIFKNYLFVILATLSEVFQFGDLSVCLFVFSNVYFQLLYLSHCLFVSCIFFVELFICPLFFCQIVHLSVALFDKCQIVDQNPCQYKTNK